MNLLFWFYKTRALNFEQNRSLTENYTKLNTKKNFKLINLVVHKKI